MLMVSAMTKQEAQNRAQTIQADAKAQIERLRGRKDLSPEAVRANIARIHLNTKQQVAALQDQVAQQAKATRQTHTEKAFGVSGLMPAGASSTTVATTIASYRDAQDRADELDDPRKAEKLMTRALDSGDEPLARALAHKAYNERGAFFGAAWDKTLSAYLEGRPEVAQAINGLIEGEQGLKGDLYDAWGWMTDTPREVERLSDGQLQQLADDPTLTAPADDGSAQTGAAQEFANWFRGVA